MGNPRACWYFKGEDFVGFLSELAMSRGGQVLPHTTRARMLERWRARLPLNSSTAFFQFEVATLLCPFPCPFSCDVGAQWLGSRFMVELIKNSFFVVVVALVAKEALNNAET